jgi:hypothetical protein
MPKGCVYGLKPNPFANACACAVQMTGGDNLSTEYILLPPPRTLTPVSPAQREHAHVQALLNAVAGADARPHGPGVRKHGWSIHCAGML